MPTDPTVLDGAAVARRLLADTAARAARFQRVSGRRPCLATVLIGDDPSSHTYVKMKVNRCAEVGIDSRRVDLPASTSTAAAVAAVDHLSADPRVDGILVQHPAPAHVDERAVFEAIAPDKDVDGVTAASFADMALGRPGFAACTPGGIVRLLDAYDIDVTGLDAVVVGASVILGRPLGMLLLAREATVTYCHVRTRDLAAHVARADLVVAAAGVPELIRGSWVRPGAVVVDAGYHPARVGDVEYAAAAARASAITPVPGGVGPMTIATLLAQTVDAAEERVALAA
jgi:methylenetetrahydrofolate dehydrogenase (NADP+) / methenyltetrahydrofolate cyclohydrolase